MNWQRLVPGAVLLLVKLTGTSLFLIFIPHTFPRGNISFVYEENWTVLPTTYKLPGAITAFPVTSTKRADIPLNPPKWEGYAGGNYWFSEDMAVWYMSWTECETLRSELVIINDRKEWEFITNKTMMADYFIGLTYNMDEDKWGWNDNSQLDRNLFTMKPNERGKDCATIRAGEVTPASCHQKRRWICERRDR